MVSNIPGESLVRLQVTGKWIGQVPGGITAGTAGSCGPDLAKNLLLVSWSFVSRCTIPLCVCFSSKEKHPKPTKPEWNIIIIPVFRKATLLNNEKIPMSSIQLIEVKTTIQKCPEGQWSFTFHVRARKIFLSKSQSF